MESRGEEMDGNGVEMDGREETFTGGTKLKELYKRMSSKAGGSSLRFFSVVLFLG